jgi:hypothetical protein
VNCELWMRYLRSSRTEKIVPVESVICGRHEWFRCGLSGRPAGRTGGVCIYTNSTSLSQSKTDIFMLNPWLHEPIQATYALSRKSWKTSLISTTRQRDIHQPLSKRTHALPTSNFNAAHRGNTAIIIIPVYCVR